MKGLSDKQSEILEYVSRFIAEHGMPPTVQEIAAHLEITGPTTFAHLKALQRKGYISRSSKARDITLLKSGEPIAFAAAAAEGPANSTTVPVPIIGRVSAGAPLLAEEHVEATLQFDPSSLPLTARRQTLFGLRVNGDSMQDLGIYDGDIVIARQADSAKNHDIVVAMVDGDTTVKTFHVDGDTVELRPANREYAPMQFPRRRVQIQGVVVALQRVM